MFQWLSQKKYIIKHITTFGDTQKSQDPLNRALIRKTGNYIPSYTLLHSSLSLLPYQEKGLLLSITRKKLSKRENE